MEQQQPQIRGEVPGPGSRRLAARLARVECAEVTCLVEPPLFWERGAGPNVWDVDGNRYVDLIAGFGAAVIGYADEEIAGAVARQARELQHAMGDVYPARVKLELLECLTELLPGDLGSVILSHSGSDAVESALKTAVLATGRPGVVAFEGAYHGLGLGALDVTHREEFRSPFAERLPERTRFVPYGDAGAARDALRETGAGAVLVEPIQGRGGLRFPPAGFLRELREICDASGALLIADEVYTGLGRTGHWLACEREDVVPDVVALGKALGGGLPLSACAGRPEVMSAWPASRGEALHTSTHLGNPVTCAAGLATLQALRARELPARARREGSRCLELLRRELGSIAGVREIRGEGLLIGIELDDPARARRTVARLLREGWITLCEGPRGDVIALSPALDIERDLLDAAVIALGKALR